ncbi:hypothetical protein ACFFMN_42565 [Planobispora siamensis]|uniref:Uncharacterized protein n=1 Tax=Planobispora siamensis TaxID=936338 RepID=A0A8J3SS56_9ACTN|nr:hypothetical protein [Planobispora siamensis]GIH97720.1 hypothetical protein Psi01_83500 [Planobispora siamensis]
MSATSHPVAGEQHTFTRRAQAALEAICRTTGRPWGQVLEEAVLLYAHLTAAERIGVFNPSTGCYEHRRLPR